MRRLILLLILSCCAHDAIGQISSKLKPAFPALTFDRPVDIQAPPDGSGRLFVVEQTGTIRVFAEDETILTAEPFLDLTDRVVEGGERGLLGLTFHPHFPDSNYVFVNYTAPDPLRTVISRFTVPAATSGGADASSERVLLEVPQPFSNHNAGQLQFGPDGYLYVGMGDGGSGGDPHGNGQNLGTLLGSMLRLNVDGGGLPPDCGGAGATYTIPADNPFVGIEGACDEAFAYGFRNPWRFSFGPDGTLYVADVGQGAREEVDIVVAGGNYGWNMLEGSICFQSNCEPAGTILPVAEYLHDSETGGFSITGGYVYTGDEPGCASLQGRYLYGDFVSGNIWLLDLRGLSAQIAPLVRHAGINISTFGVGGSGVLYLADHGGGALYRLDCDVLLSAATAPKRSERLHFSRPTPNPASNVVHLTLTAAVPEHVIVSVFDLLGRRVQVLFEGVLHQQTFTLDTTGFPDGVYLIQARGETGGAEQQVTIVR